MRTEEKSGEETESMENDEWDDTLLVKAYDKAIMLTKEKVAAKIFAEKEEGEIKESNTKDAVRDDAQAKRGNPKRDKWRVGMHCGAEYSVDGLVYEAIITKIDYDNGTCIVKYIGYNNEEEVDLRSLRPSRGRQAQNNQRLEATASEFRNNAHPHQNVYPENNDAYPQNSGMIPPPPPPFVMANLPKDETDALSAMLMSWYMSGYHTGYYQGLTRSKMSSRPYNFRNGH